MLTHFVKPTTETDVLGLWDDYKILKIYLFDWLLPDVSSSTGDATCVPKSTC